MWQRRYKRGKFGARRVTTTSQVARITRQVIQRRAETKCFSQVLVSAGAVVNTWLFVSAMAGLTQGTSQTSRIGNGVHIVAIEFVLEVTPVAGNVSNDGDTCRMVIYHNKAPAGSLPTAAQVWDSNNLTTGRNVVFKDQFRILEDFNHNMVITTTTPTVGPRFNRIVRVTPRENFQYQGNVGTISDCFTSDYGMGYVATGSSCCNITITSKVWFKDI